METSTLILTALLQLNDELKDDDSFCGYTDDHEGTARLLSELWDIAYTAICEPWQDEFTSPQELVNAWYEQLAAQTAF